MQAGAGCNSYIHGNKEKSPFLVKFIESSYQIHMVIFNDLVTSQIPVFTPQWLNSIAMNVIFWCSWWNKKYILVIGSFVSPSFVYDLYFVKNWRRVHWQDDGVMAYNEVHVVMFIHLIDVRWAISLVHK